MKKFLVCLSFISLFGSTAFAQKGYEIEVQIKGVQDTVAYLANYFDDKNYLQDTAQVDGKGQFVFQGSEALPHGVYIVVMNKNRLFELAIGQDQIFRMETDTTDYVGKMAVEGSDENQAFYESIRFNININKKAEGHLYTSNDEAATPADKAKAEAEIALIQAEAQAYQEQVIRSHPNTIISKLMMASKQPEIPEAAPGIDAQQFALNYYRDHYFDYFDLSDDALLRLPNPYYKQKLEYFLDKLYAQHPDSLIQVIEGLVAKAKSNEETYKYVVWKTTIRYERPEIMGLDRVFVHMVDKYFSTGEMDYWVNETVKENLVSKAKQLRGVLIGEVAPEMKMMDLNLKPVSLYDLKSKYTLVYFWNPDCGHCKTETPKLKEFYDTYKERFDLEVFAVSTDSSMQKMKEYIEDKELEWVSLNGPRSFLGNFQDQYDAFSTPLMYVLDDKKRIIAKKILSEQLLNFLENYEKNQADE